MSKQLKCPNCGASDVSLFYQLRDVPVHSVVLMRSWAEARRIERGRVDLGFCGRCGFIGNFSFEEALINYATEYECTQAYSPTFNDYHAELATQLIERYDLRGKHIVEIGCGHGEFISLLCRLGDNCGLGFDPAYQRPLDADDETNNVRFIRDYYSGVYSDFPVDFVACKMTLEHIFETGAFARQLRVATECNSNAVVFIQVPDASRILTEAAFWDIHYEHCCYFTPTSLAAAFHASGFDVVDVRRSYYDTYLVLEAKPRTASTQHAPFEQDGADDVRRLVERFKTTVTEKTAAWKESIGRAHAQKRKVVLWGSSSKATAFLTTLGVDRGIDYVVDINPYRQGTFMPGTGQPIIAPQFLQDYQPDDVIVINPIYCNEVRTMIDSLGIDARLTTPQEPGLSK